MLSDPKIDNFSVGFDWTDSAYAGMAQKVSCSAKLKLANLKNVVTAKGTYAANNDYLYLLQNIPVEKKPNFLILVCSGHLNLTMATPLNFAMSALPIFKFFEFMMPTESTYQINGVYIEGRPSNSPFPMPQGIPIDYFMIAGQADIS